MKCPSCNSAVADDAAVCPSCDHVLDPSLFDASPPDADRAPARPRPVSKGGAVKPTGAKKVLKKKPVTSSRGGPRMPEAPAPTRAESAPAHDWRSKLNEEDWGPAPVPKNLEPQLSSDPDDAMEDVKRFLLELSSADKLALFGAVAMLLACFFPWKETVREGVVLGLLSLGVVVFIGGIVAISAIAVRVRKVGNFNPVLPWMVQLLAIAGSLVWCLIYIRLSWDSTLARAPVGNYEMMVSKPSIGVFLAFIGGCVSVLGSFFGLKESR